ncbi:MAG: hypothetical protein A2259_02515 [Candidatus Moranbacteria bacterium RIFOXYA2_FULL_43_15]|nr:MAG: hypothetical protein A2259_02515 [Candidatus Moranbacteria bacterium RIFOXYA2_FULL_43_15]
MKAVSLPSGILAPQIPRGKLSLSLSLSLVNSQNIKGTFFDPAFSMSGFLIDYNFKNTRIILTKYQLLQ